ncbi:MAG: phosphopentomutase [Mycobacterium leprae]
MAQPVKRVTIIVLDSVGIGALPDADQFGDVGANTLGNLSRMRGGVKLPNMGQLGLGNLVQVAGVPPVERPAGALGRMATASIGKDTMTGHWEMAGVRIDVPFRTFPHGFEEDLIKKFIVLAGVPGVLGNKVASGTEIIEELGEEHMRTKKPIVYTSADSVWQVACHEEVYSVPQIYKMCEVARELLNDPKYRVGRVIARPFVGTGAGSFKRTANRHDLALEPPAMLLDFVKNAGMAVQAVGKIKDIFTGHGVTEHLKTASNSEGIDATETFLRSGKPGLIFANLVDFDMLYGHRRDVEGYARALEEFDARLPELISLMGPDDVLFLTADHGNDPTYKGTDHTREYVPLLAFGQRVKPGADLGTRPRLADLGATACELLDIPWRGQQGESFAAQLLQ